MKKTNQRKPKYNFKEIVEILNSKRDVRALNKKGHIASMVMNDNGKWVYGVFLFEYKEVWMFDEDDLKSTKQFISEEDNKTTLKVKVDETGKGELA